MIHVDNIIIREFRGIRDLTIDFADKNFGICGPNGTGKSGIVDAIEFGLTGSISRLSGKGTGGISVKEHAPHVDSRNHPDKARVIMRVTIPSLRKKVTIERTVKDPLTPIITPNDADVLEVLAQVAIHPEFALSRRELIRYVISAPGDRAKEVQALLRLDDVETIRTIFQKIANACQREIVPTKRERDQALEQLLRALDIPTLSAEKLLGAANSRRILLGLGPIAVLTPTTSLRDGLVASAAASPSSRVPKVQATTDLRNLREVIARMVSAETSALVTAAITELSSLNSDSAALNSVTRERFLQAALSLIDADACPVCDTQWNPEELKGHIMAKLKLFEEVARKRVNAERKLEPVLAVLTDFKEALAVVERYGPILKPAIDVKLLRDFRLSVEAKYKEIQAFLPLPTAIAALQTIAIVPANALDPVAAIETAVAAIPEPTQQDAARDYLTVCQERLEAYRGVSLRLKQAEERAKITREISETYAKVSTSVLEGIYKEVEKEFSDLYRFINREDEGKFSAQLTPTTGKLGFEVDFYGRGYFPPGAYHSEGHQDGMGICLYLALMKHQLGKSFTFAVLDDVLMSVDAGHRREVCNLLKERFPNTQFILTTHDPIWLKHMRTVGLISSKSSIHFRKWHVDQGPTEWDTRDVWQEIKDSLAKNEVRAAAGLLRHYLEYISAEICHRLRAPVEFRGDAQFQLGDLLPAAIGRFNKTLKEGRSAAESWGQTDAAKAISDRETDFAARVTKSNIEQWQINPAIHYNEWENLQAADFGPVADAFRELIDGFICQNPKCNGLLYVVPERGQREELKCACGVVTMNLKKRPQQVKAKAA
jgi:recombinational DNA repair ATPase RecF